MYRNIVITTGQLQYGAGCFGVPAGTARFYIRTPDTGNQCRLPADQYPH